MKKYGSGTYSEGFAEGWRSVHGVEVETPKFLARAIPAGKSPYQVGYDHGVEIARKQKIGSD